MSNISQKMNEKYITCPVCGGPSKMVSEHPRDKIKQSLENVFGVKYPEDEYIENYSLQQCEDCDLAFANPMIAGSGGFYNWLGEQEKYHSGMRWEWKEIANIIQNREKCINVLELGCGEGKLLHFLKSKISSKNEISYRGIDQIARSIESAKQKGIDARIGSVFAIEEIFADINKFDVIILSHVLEHVENPLEIMNYLKGFLSDTGCVLASVPYSPMSRETLHFDIMNLPPHHLTRWNKQSMEKLAETVDMKPSFWVSKIKSPFKRAILQTTVKFYNSKGISQSKYSAGKRLRAVFSDYSTFKSLLKKNNDRPIVNGQKAGDTFLVQFE